MASGILDLLKPYKPCLIVCLAEFVIASIFYHFYKDEAMIIMQRLFLVFMFVYLFFIIYLPIYIKIKYPESYHGMLGFNFKDTIYNKALNTPDIIVRRKIFHNIICCMVMNFFNMIAILILWDLIPRLLH